MSITLISKRLYRMIKSFQEKTSISKGQTITGFKKEEVYQKDKVFKRRFGEKKRTPGVKLDFLAHKGNQQSNSEDQKITSDDGKVYFKEEKMKKYEGGNCRKHKKD